MRIGHHAPDIWSQGGVASYIRRLGQAQSNRGHDVFYLSDVLDASYQQHPFHHRVSSDAILFRKARELDLDIVHLHKPIKTLPPRELPVVRTIHDNTASCPSGSRYLSRWETPCDRTYSLSKCLWGHFVDHCGSCRPSSLKSSFHRFYTEREVLPHMPVMTVSQYVKEKMVQTGFDADDLHVVQSPALLNPEPYCPPPSASLPRFVFVGRIVPEKGLEWLLRAVAKANVELQLDIAGSGYAEEDMQQKTRKLGITDSVTFHGWLESKRVYDLIRQARAVVVPSVWNEPAGLVTLEAAALGRPVIASRAGGIPEYALKDYALLASPNDIQELSECLIELAQDWSLADRMGRRGYELVPRKFSMDSFLDSVFNVYEMAQADKPRDAETA